MDDAMESNGSVEVSKKQPENMVYCNLIDANCCNTGDNLYFILPEKEKMN